MAQHDYNISNQSGAAFRADLNNALSAIVSNNSGAVEPSTTYAYQFWADTTAGVLKQRNAANSAWVTLFQLDGEWSTIALENGTGAAPSLYFKDSGTDTGLYSPGVDQLGVATAGVQRVNFNGATEVVFNDTGADVDFRIEGDTEPNLFVIDAGTDQVRVKNLNGGPLAGTRNRIINGDMRIDQRNAGASVTPLASTEAYSVDRWKGNQTLSSKYSLQQNAGAVTPPTGFSNYVGVTSLSTYSVLSTDTFALIQAIEGFNIADFNFGTANAATVTLSFWARSSLTGTFGGSLCNSASNRSYTFSYSINASNTWEYKTISIPGDTTGTWLTNNGQGINVRFGLGSGSNYTGTVNTWNASNAIQPSSTVSVVGTNGATFYITGVQLEAGSVATPFERRSYGQELSLCERYYETTIPLTANSYFGNYNSSAGGHVAITLNTGDFYSYGEVRFRTRKRGTPTITIRNVTFGSNGQLNTANEIRNISGSVNLSATVSNVSDISYRLNTSGATANSAVAWHHELSAEL